MLITINDLSDPPRQVEVELPLYRTIDTSNDRFEVNYFYKVEERDGTLLRHEICINGLVGINIETIDGFSFAGVSPGFIIAENGYKVSGAEEFSRAWNQARATLEGMVE